MSGIYVIEFEIYPGIYKIGCSRNIKNRVKQIKTDSLILGNVEVMYQKEFQDFQKAETLIHSLLAEYRVQENREFFKVDIDKIKKVIVSLDPNDFILHNTKGFEQNRTQQIFKWMCEHKHQEDQTVDLTAATREQLCKELGISNNQITNSLSKLKRNGLISGKQGTFTIL